MKRTHTCGELTLKNANQTVLLQGWVHKVRKMGKMTFVDLRDRYGITQLVVADDKAELLEHLKSEYVISAEGTVVERKSKNPALPTGEIEVIVTDIELINAAHTPPFLPTENVETSEDTRLTYRYLDLRRAIMQQNLVLRAKINAAIREFLNGEEFLEVETPVLGRSTPEGARDFLVPSRLHAGHFYALPQSPQLFKQLLMVAGLDRYYQIVRCFRDEDLRADRQPEFTQLDMEMAFATDQDVMAVAEALVKHVLKVTKGIVLDQPFPRIPYAQAIHEYGSDKPDLRFALKISDLNEVFAASELKLVKEWQANKHAIRGIAVDQLLPRKTLEELEETARQNHLKGLAALKYEKGA